ncbi:MAG: MFS transporter [Thermomicrobiales bacterium]
MNALSRTDRRAVLAALLAVLLGALDLTVISTILPAMITDLRVNAADIDRYVWVVNSYLLTYILAIPVFGRVSDLLGRVPAFVGSLVLFAGGSLWCAMAADLPHMIAGRALQGAGGGALLPITMALIGDVLPPGQRSAALGLVGAIDTLGWVLGPLWGALLVGIAPGEQPWRWAFWINIPLAAAVGVVILLTNRERHARPPDWLRQLDVPGALLLAGALTAFNVALSAGGELGASGSGGRALGGSRNPVTEHIGLLLAVALIFGILFVVRQRRATHPLLPVSLFRDRLFAAAIVANFLVGAALISAMVDVPVVTALLVDMADVSRVAALMLAPFTACIAVLSFAGGRLNSRFGARNVTVAGFILVTAGYALLWIGLRNGSLMGMAPGLIIAGAGFGLSFAPIGATAIDAAPAADRGIASAMTLVFRLLGMTTGISLLTAIAVRRLQGLVGDLTTIVQGPNESTSEFLARQTAMLYETVLPLSLQVARESFLLAGAIALLGILPALRFGSTPGEQPTAR